MLISEKIEVYQGKEGHVVLKQEDGCGDSIIMLTPQQINIVCKEMKNVAREIEGFGN